MYFLHSLWTIPKLFFSHQQLGFFPHSNEFNGGIKQRIKALENHKSHIHILISLSFKLHWWGHKLVSCLSWMIIIRNSKLNFCSLKSSGELRIVNCVMYRSSYCHQLNVSNHRSTVFFLFDFIIISCRTVAFIKNLWVLSWVWEQKHTRIIYQMQKRVNF